MSFVVIYDACVLHEPALRDLLIRVANKRALNLAARWTDKILDEMVESILRRRPDLDRARLSRTRELMCQAVPDCLVTGYEGLSTDLDLPDADDRHVLAAAIRARAEVIVAFNVDDFPESALGPYDVVARHPDDFVHDLIELHPASVVAALAEQAADLKNPPQSLVETVKILAARGLPRSAEAIERHIE